jgi:hypothetical protein
VKKILCFIGVGMLLGACARTKPPICQSTAEKVCIEYSGTGYGDSELQAAVSAQCGARSGYSFTAAGDCQKGTEVGSCTRNPGKTFEQKERYFNGGTKTAIQLETECTAEGGVFRN